MKMNMKRNMSSTTWYYFVRFTIKWHMNLRKTEQMGALATGERRIRVHTLSLPISSVLGNLFRAADLDAQSCDLVRKSATKLLTGACSLFAAKEVALTTTVNTLYAYRKFCASNNSTGLLILPEGLKAGPTPLVFPLHLKHTVCSRVPVVYPFTLAASFSLTWPFLDKGARQVLPFQLTFVSSLESAHFCQLPFVSSLLSAPFSAPFSA